MPPWIVEWQMSHFHLWGWECSHWSAVMSRRDWNVFVCMSLCERDKRVERKKREGESVMMRFWLHYSSSHQIFHWRVPRHPHLSSQRHRSFTLLTTWQVCLQKKSMVVHPLPDADWFDPFTNLKKGEEMCRLCNMKLDLKQSSWDVQHFQAHPLTGAE